MAGIIFGCIMLSLVGWAILKGKYAPFILFASGVAMLLFSVVFDTGSFMPKKALPTGSDYLNIIEFQRYSFSNNLSNLGLLIMTMVGFASYMTHIGANDAFVNIAIKPLSLIKSPYALVFLAFLLGKAVSMVTSAVGLGVLCLALMGPALAALGMNKKTIAAVFVTSGAASMVLLGGSTAASAKACELSILDYVFIYKIPAALPTVLVMGIAHVFWQRYLDRKEGWIPSEHLGEKLVFEGDDVKRPSTAAPKIYAVLPFLPMVFVVVFSQYCIESIKLNITTLMLFCVTIAMICEAIRWRGNIDKLGAGLKAFLMAMGKSCSGVVALVIAAGVFATGFKALGMIDAIVGLATSVGAGGLGMSILFVVITTLVTIIAGSNGASFYPLVEMVPHIAKSMGVNPVMLVLPMHQASTIARPLSPVAGVVVAISAMCKMSPLELVKRASVPSILGLISHHIFVFWLSV